MEGPGLFHQTVDLGAGGSQANLIAAFPNRIEVLQDLIDVVPIRTAQANVFALGQPLLLSPLHLFIVVFENPTNLLLQLCTQVLLGLPLEVVGGFRQHHHLDGVFDYLDELIEFLAVVLTGRVFAHYFVALVGAKDRAVGADLGVTTSQADHIYFFVMQGA